MMGYRCSNNRLFMFGMANEGRLGVHIEDLRKSEDPNYKRDTKGKSK